MWRATRARRSPRPAARLVGLDPLSESAQRHLINAYLRAGDRAAAERQYETCARLLKAELAVEPDAQTRALLAVLRVGEPMSGARTRYAERGGLHIAYQVVGTGRPDIVLVPGFVSHVERIWDEPRAASSCSTGAASVCPIAWAHRRRWRQRPRTSRPPWMRPAAAGCC